MTEWATVVQQFMWILARPNPRTMAHLAAASRSHLLEAIPHFEVDLDRPAEQRWAPVCAAFRSPFAEVVERNRAVFDALDSMPGVVCALALRTLPRAQREDARALAAGLGAPRGVVALLQLVYEAFSLTDALHGEHAGGGPLGDAPPRGGGALGCTSLVRACADGAVVHARTLDWGWLEGLDALLVDLTFSRGGEPLYRSTTFVGFVGVLTALRCGGEPAAGRGAYSVSLNYRRPFAGRWDAAGRPSLAVPPLWRNGPAWRALALALFRGAWPVAAWLRDVTETCATFEQARARLAEAGAGAASAGAEPEAAEAAEAAASGRGGRGGGRGGGGGDLILAPCFVTLAGRGRADGVVLACDAGGARRAQALSGRAGEALCVANIDPLGDDVPREDAVAAPYVSFADALGAKDLAQGESLLRRDVGLRLAARAGRRAGRARSRG